MRREPCRNFQHGSCSYGDRCKFLHVIQQQPKPNVYGFNNNAGLQQRPKPNNVFGFNNNAGLQQQQKPNPFGFGVQSNQSKGINDSGNKQNQFKNTWNRFNPAPNSGAPSSRQPDNQTQVTNHKCTDPESCKRIIAEDFEHERPLWKLTCYGHWKNAPCDIVGDVSFEELRAAAYDDAKCGLSLQSIVERERNSLNSKIMEFQNLLRNPYQGAANSAAKQSPFPGASQNAFSATAQNSTPPSVSSFSQLGTSLNTGFAARPSAASNNLFGQPNPVLTSAPASGTFGTNSFPPSIAGSFGSQQPDQTLAASFSPNMASFSNSSVISTTNNQFPFAAVTAQNPSLSTNEAPTLSLFSNPSSTSNGQSTTTDQLGNNLQKETVSGDGHIWLKEKWIPGEIPEEAPPDAYIQ